MYAQSGVKSGSINVMMPASCGETARKLRAKSHYGIAIWSTP